MPPRSNAARSAATSAGRTAGGGHLRQRGKLGKLSVMPKAAMFLLPRDSLVIPREGQRRHLAGGLSEHHRVIARPKAPA